MGYIILLENLTLYWHDSGSGDYNQKDLILKTIIFAVDILYILNLKDITLAAGALPFVHKLLKDDDHQSTTAINDVIYNARFQMQYHSFVMYKHCVIYIRSETNIVRFF